MPRSRRMESSCQGGGVFMQPWSWTPSAASSSLAGSRSLRIDQARGLPGPHHRLSGVASRHRLARPLAPSRSSERGLPANLPAMNGNAVSSELAQLDPNLRRTWGAQRSAAEVDLLVQPEEGLGGGGKSTTASQGGGAQLDRHGGWSVTAGYSATRRRGRQKSACSQAFISRRRGSARSRHQAWRHLFRWLAWARPCSAGPGEMEPPAAACAAAPRCGRSSRPRSADGWRQPGCGQVAMTPAMVAW
jgi:hypothetical protein